MKSLLKLSLAFSLVVVSHANAQTTSYSVTVAANSKDLCAYCFDTSSLANALPNAPYGTVVWWWDASVQAYYSSTRRPSGWTTSHNLSPGEGFFVQNTGTNAYTFTVQGTPLTAASYTMSFPTSAYYYLIGSAYPIAVDGGWDWLECMPDCTGNYHRYTTQSYNYVGNTGDTVWFWCPDAQAWSAAFVRHFDNNGPCGGPPPSEYWYDVPLFGSPSLDWGSASCGGSANYGGTIGRGFFLQPAGGTASWTHLSTGQTCP